MKNTKENVHYQQASHFVVQCWSPGQLSQTSRKMHGVVSSIHGRKKGETQERDGRSWGLKRRNEIWNLHWGLLNYNVTWLNRKPLIESALYEGTHIYLIVHIVYCWANIIGCTKRNTFSRLCDFFSGETSRIHIKEYK